MSERKYPIRNPNQARALADAFKLHLGANVEAGNNAFASGHIDPFQAYSVERLSKEYVFLLELSPSSQDEIFQRAIEPLKAISFRYGIEQIYPGDGMLSPHITLEVAQFPTLASDEERKSLTAGLRENWGLKKAACVLPGIEFPLDTVVPSGRDTYIGAGAFTVDVGAIHKTRRIIEKAVKKTGLEMPVKNQAILHSTIGRIIAAPNDPDALLAYGKAVEAEIGQPLRSSPITAVIQDVYFGPALKYHLENSAPQT